MRGDGEGKVSSRVTWDQGGQDSTTQKEGFQVSKREVGKGESARGVKRKCAITEIANLYMCIIS
jgi:hypothetical protein